jgi:hypothetical protein
MSMRRLAPPLLIILAACGGDDDGGGGGDGGDDSSADAASSGEDGSSTDAPDSGFAAAVVERTCAPNDGPAITLKLAAAVDPETCTPDFDAATLIISVYLDAFEVNAPVTYTFDPESLSGSAESCPGGEGVCRDATAGQLHFDTFVEDEGASGTFELTIEGGPITGGFDAIWCNPEGGGPYCG